MHSKFVESGIKTANIKAFVASTFDPNYGIKYEHKFITSKIFLLRGNSK